VTPHAPSTGMWSHRPGHLGAEGPSGALRGRCPHSCGRSTRRSARDRQVTGWALVWSGLATRLRRFQVRRLTDPRSQGGRHRLPFKNDRLLVQVDLQVLSRRNRDHDRGPSGGTVGTVWAATTCERGARSRSSRWSQPHRSCSPTSATGCRRAGWSWRIPPSGLTCCCPQAAPPPNRRTDAASAD